MIRFACECGKTLQTPDESAGKKVRCPACQAILQVPQQKAIQEEEPADREDPPSRSGKGSTRIRTARPEEEWEEEDRPRARRRKRDEEEDYDRKPRRSAPESSGKAMASLVLGLLSFLCGFSVFAGLPALILGFLALKDLKKGVAGSGKGMAITGIVFGFLGTILIPLMLLGFYLMVGAAATGLRNASMRVQAQTNLKQIGLALHSYHDIHNQLPGSGVGPGGKPLRDAQQKPLLSWRVAILPYLEEDRLYQQFKLDEPWDSPHNIKLLPQMPKVYLVPGKLPDGSGQTHYQAFVGPGSLFEKSVRMPEVTDGLSKTLMVVEAATAVPWTKPEDLRFDPQGPMPPLGVSSDGFNAVLGDGSVRFFSRTLGETLLKGLITRNGGEVVAVP